MRSCAAHRPPQASQLDEFARTLLPTGDYWEAAIAQPATHMIPEHQLMITVHAEQRNPASYLSRLGSLVLACNLMPMLKPKLAAMTVSAGITPFYRMPSFTTIMRSGAYTVWLELHTCSFDVSISNSRHRVSWNYAFDGFCDVPTDQLRPFMFLFPSDTSTLSVEATMTTSANVIVTWKYAGPAQRLPWSDACWHRFRTNSNIAYNEYFQVYTQCERQRIDWSTRGVPYNMTPVVCRWPVLVEDTDDAKTNTNKHGNATCEAADGGASKENPINSAVRYFASWLDSGGQSDRQPIGWRSDGHRWTVLDMSSSPITPRFAIFLESPRFQNRHYSEKFPEFLPGKVRQISWNSYSLLKFPRMRSQNFSLSSQKIHFCKSSNLPISLLSTTTTTTNDCHRHARSCLSYQARLR